MHKLPQAPIRIIIADDHAIFREGLRRLLVSEKDFVVIAEASDGKEAVLLTQKLKPDIVLLDLAMPRVPGMEALRELARAKVSAYTILLTAAIEPFEISSAMRLGARGVVLKASPPELLLRCIRAVSEGEYWIGSGLLKDWAHLGQGPGGGSELTSREVEIVSAIKTGRSNKEIAAQMSISEETVKRHLSNIYAKLGISSRLELALLASRDPQK